MATSRYPATNPSALPHPSASCSKRRATRARRPAASSSTGERWRQAVGERIASRTEPGRLRGGVLTIHAASSAWAQELTFLAPGDSHARSGARSFGEIAALRRSPDGRRGPPSARHRARTEPAQAPPRRPRGSGSRASLIPSFARRSPKPHREWLSRPAVSAKGRARDPRAAEARSGPTDPASKHWPGASRRRP